MPADLTPAELTLLGLLTERPRHGYELEEVITDRGMREWTEIGFSSIYYLLGRLDKRGLIAQVAAPPGTRGRARKVYAATAEGRRVCAESAEAAIAEPRPVFPAVLVGLANQPAVPPERLRAALDRRAAALEERATALRRAAYRDRHAPAFVQAIFDYSLRQLDAERAWLAAYRASLPDAPDPEESEPAMTPYDVKRAHRDLYAPKNTTWALVDVPEQRFIAVDGSGDPNTSHTYTRAVEALYSTAYAIKFAGKRAGRDLVVAPLEGLWWADDWAAFTVRAKETWRWTMMISQPGWVTEETVEEAKQAVSAKGRPTDVSGVHLKTLHEGRCAQVLHVGPYDDEAALLAELHHEYLDANGLTYSGLHHEIYLSDPRRTAPAKLRTILRQPVRPAG
ncbi:GyrI-like domain-containing protein [Marinactinospora rubrisoli]|uniref:GyrI-like domain-containing protein n=1 Tax=Marinactinospora rubrisoli TaxID=2715399 RepID=A0ABW2KNL9_9ACTN